MIKKIISIILIICLTICGKANIFADDLMIENGFTADELREIYMNSQEFLGYYESDPEGAMELLDETIDKILTNQKYIGQLQSGNNVSINAHDQVTNAWVNTTLVQQSFNNFCGPACALMAIYGWGGNIQAVNTTEKQIVLGNNMGITLCGDGAGVFSIVNTLNYYLNQSNLGYNYSGYIKSSFTGSLQFLQRIYISLANDRMPILHAYTPYLNYYNGNVYYHYIGITSANLTSGAMTAFDRIMIALIMVLIMSFTQRPLTRSVTLLTDI